MDTILIVDDTKTNIDLLLELLSDYDLVVATDGRSALQIAAQEKIGMILLDIMMPEMDGFEVCEYLKSSLKTKDIPVIFITARVDEESIEKGYELGGVDYVTKPFKPKELLAKVKTHFKMSKLIEELNHMASHDQMTGIYNRGKFFEKATKLFDEGDSLMAVMIDIDDFKKINDTYGHPFGDKVIKAVVQEIRSLLDEDAVFGRLGGEEFAIVAHFSKREKGYAKIEQIRSAIEHLVISNEDASQSVTVSIGVAEQTAQTQDIDMLLKEADEALYEVKASGKNSVALRTR
ncbi:MAG: diguanylate cyclase [Helicobacteraceae bacterium]|nr:diguanylate cyclase [Helicobacteraceae bacterium]